MLLVFTIVKRSALCRFIEFEIVEQIVYYPAVVKPDLRELAAVDCNDFVNVSGPAGVIVVDRSIVRVSRLGPRRCLHAAQRGVVPVHEKRLRRRITMIIEYRGRTPVV